MIKIYTDGGSRGNPGKSACAFLVTRDKETVYENAKFLGVKTNNEAEYNAIILALNWVGKNLSSKEIEIISDSELVIKQLNGEYKIKMSHLKKLNEEIRKIIDKNNFNIRFLNVKRENEFISRADFLVNKILDAS